MVGFVSDNLVDVETMEQQLNRMVTTLLHRGPDDSGLWVNAQFGLGIGHRRLSVIDLSPAGHQPMVSPSERYVIAFNGEIYNHQELRHQLSDWLWKGSSDTETILACIESWGIAQTLQNMVGMFAIVLWDRAEKALYLIRDRMGEKPLYYGWQKGVFLFASELKAIKVHPAFENRVDRNAVVLQMRYNNIPAPYSIYQGINKLLPGTFII